MATPNQPQLSDSQLAELEKLARATSRVAVVRTDLRCVLRTLRNYCNVWLQRVEHFTLLAESQFDSSKRRFSCCDGFVFFNCWEGDLGRNA
jgi:hypothetical protein